MLDQVVGTSDANLQVDVKQIDEGLCILFDWGRKLESRPTIRLSQITRPPSDYIKVAKALEHLAALPFNHPALQEVYGRYPSDKIYDYATNLMINE